MEKFVGILRSGDALTARQVRQNIAADFTDCAAVALAFSEGRGCWYEFVDCPLTDLSPPFPQQAALREAWSALGDAVTLDTDAARLALTQTVLDQPLPRVLTLPETAPMPVRVKPTAAHPRAFAGTKYQPPTPKAPAARDWRPFLCHPRSLATLAPDAAAEAQLPLLFRTSLYPLVRHQSEAEVAEALALYWAMALDSSVERLAAAAYLLCLQPGPNTLAWGRVVLSQAPEHWTALLHLLIASGADTANVQQLPPLFAETLAEALHGKDAFYRAYWLLHSLETQIDPAYLMAGYRLADTLGKSYAFHDVRRSGYCPISTLLQWGDYCREAEGYYSEMLLSFWKECGLRDGLGEHLGQANHTRLTPDAAYRWLRLLCCSWNDWDDLSDEEASAKWAAARPQVGAMLALVQGVPAEYQDKCAWHLMEYLWQWDTPQELQSYLPSALTLTHRLCRPPFAVKNDPTEAVTNSLAHLSPAQRERFLQAPDASFRRLEQACRRDNDATLIGRGTWTLTRHQAEWTLLCFEQDPERLFHAAKRLGTLPAPKRDDVARMFVLSDAEVPKVALARLEQAVIETLANGFPAEVREQADKHTLQMQQIIGDNRKALRKFLIAHWEGRTDYRQTHPLTRQWLAAHPGLDLEVWQHGVTLHAETDLGVVMLSVEQNPLEALKLGTYVGSCLGLGGSFAYSAAAVVLDINKQVIYARDKRGSVVGRQLAVISEDNQLVCYEVYPLSAQKELNSVFKEFDQLLASALGLTIYRSDETGDYKIACILSHDWWDDCAWNLTGANEQE